MIELPSPLPVVENLEPEDRLFVHSANPDWGVGLWVREERTRRRLRFEDGELRTFKKGYYDFLTPVDPDRDDLDDVFGSLVDEHEQVVAERRAEQARADKPPVMSFEEQLAVFRHLYPEGFQDPAYVDAFRGTSGGSYSKRHVDEEIGMAAERLTRSVLRDQISAEDFGGVVDSMVAILKRSMLVKPADGHRPLAAVEDPALQKELAVGLYALLYGEDRYRKRFKTWIHVLRHATKQEPSWAMATLFPALVSPDKHVCVKRRVFVLQALEVRPGATVPKTVNRRGYRRSRRIAKKVHTLLVDAGLEPRDMLDVRRFVWDTLRPKGQQVRDELKKKR